MSCCMIDASEVGSALVTFFTLGAVTCEWAAGMCFIEGNAFKRKLASFDSMSASSAGRGGAEVALERLAATHMETSMTAEIPTRKRTLIVERGRIACTIL